MDKMLLTEIAAIRLCVGFLGEAGNHSWWPSSFFSETSAAFLTPVFNKTSFLTQYYGVKAAAAIVHDEHIGVGKDVFHLFRLPEHFEIEIHGLFGNSEAIDFAQQAICDKNTAQQFLLEYAGAGDIKEFGPVRLGDMKDISKKSIWKNISFDYAEAFKSGNKIFPYFSTGK